MTGLEMRKRLLLAHIYSAFDNPRDAYGDVASEIVFYEDETTAEEELELEALGLIHQNMMDEGIFGTLEKNIDVLVHMMAKGPLEYKTGSLDATDDDYERMYFDSHKNIGEAKKQYIENRYISNRYLFLVLKKEEYI